MVWILLQQTGLSTVFRERNNETPFVVNPGLTLVASDASGISIALARHVSVPGL